MLELPNAFDGFAKQLLVFVEDMNRSAESRPLFLTSDDIETNKDNYHESQSFPCVPAPMRVTAFIGAAIVVIFRLQRFVTLDYKLRNYIPSQSSCDSSSG